MDLHRSTGKADWVSIDPARYNFWQRTASRTNSIITPGNIITVVGFVLVIIGLVAILKHYYWLGLVIIAIGRLFDIADGYVAQKTGTKSPLGEGLDATLDKFAGLFVGLALIAARVASWRLVVIILLPHAIISVISIVYNHRHVRLHPSRVGKLSMAAGWLCLVGLVLVQATHSPAHSPITLITYSFAFLGVAMGLYAAIGYLADEN